VQGSQLMARAVVGAKRKAASAALDAPEVVAERRV